MSYSTFKINTSSYNECTAKLDEDTNDIYSIVAKNPNIKVLKNIVVENHYISNIVICQEYDGWILDDVFYVAYHHSNDPSIYRVLIDVYKYLEKLEKEVAK